MPPWLESHADLRDHPKVDLLMDLLAITRRDACGLLHFVWWRTLTYAPSGDLSDFTDGQIARWADWDGDPGHLVSALKTAGFMDASRTIHDWEEFAGRWIDRRAADADRKREARKAAAGRTNGSAQNGAAPDVRDVSAGHPARARTPARAPGPDLTGPDHTGQHRTQRTLHPSPPPPAEEGTAVPRDVLDRLSRLPDDLDAAAFHLAVESALVALRFSVQREVRVPDRGDGHGGRLDLVAERHGLRIAFELDDRTPRQKSIAKLEGADCQVRVIVLRCPADGPLPDVGGQVRVIGAGASIPEPEDIAPTTMDDVTLWATALAQVTDGMLPANAEKLAALEPLGRGPDGGLRLRAPPWADAGRFQGAVRAALVNAGDECGARATIVTT